MRDLTDYALAILATGFGMWFVDVVTTYIALMN